METHCENCTFKEQLQKLEQDFGDLQQNLQLSAVYGKSLLDENNVLKGQIKELQNAQERSAQENHQLRMQLEVSEKSHLSESQEFEALKEALRQAEELNEQLRANDEEQHRKESVFASQMACMKDHELAQKSEFETKIKELENEIQELKLMKREPVQMPCDHEEEITQLQAELEMSKQSIQKVTDELLQSHTQVQQLQFGEKKLQQRITELEYEIQAKEKELMSTEKLVEEKRMEVMELQALLEAERVSQTNPEKRGNSIFSEVEDRRQQVERHLAKLTSLLDREKRKNQDLQAEIVKVKNQMAFLACGGGGGGGESSKSVERMESMLRTANTQNKDLLKKIEDLENKLRVQSQSFPPIEDSKKWMQAMLAQKQEENDKLRSEIRDHIRSYLCQNDQAMQLTKRLTETEKNLQRARSEVFRLKLKLEEMATNENAASAAGVSPAHAPKTTRVVENLKFLTENQDASPAVPEKQLKERVVLEEVDAEPNVAVAAAAACEPPTCQETPVDEGTAADAGESIAPIEKAESGIMKPRDRASDEHKQRVRMNSKVNVVFEDGDSTLETLAEDKYTAGAKKPAKKPVGRQVQVVDVSTAAPVMECNQQ